MKIGFVVNDIKTEEPGYTTSRLAMAAINLGHEVWVIGVGRPGLRPGREDPRPRPERAEEEVQDVRELPQGPAGQERGHASGSPWTISTC